MEITEEMLNLAIEITAYEEERTELTRILKALDADIIKNQDKDSQLYMQECIERYKEVIKKLRILLECYIDAEQKAGLPADLMYRKYYKLILNAL